MKEMIYNGVKHIPEGIVQLDPETNSFKTSKGEYTYDVLIVSPGVELNFD